MNYITPAPLKKGDTIGLITPSSPLMPGRLEAGIPYFETKGFKVKLGNYNKNSDRFLAGRDEDRAKDVMDFFKDPEVKAIIATGGGYGSQRILPFLDYELIRKNPKIVVGASDTTALELGLLKKAGLSSYTGFTLADTQDGDPSPIIDRTLMSCLMGESYSLKEGTLVHPGVVEAPLVGGNLECITALMGTPYQPNFTGSILLLEGVREEPYQADRKLSQLDLAGVFNQVAGVIFCHFEDCVAKYFPERDGDIEDVISEWSSRFNVPCIKDFPYGHGSNRCVLPIGRNITLDASNTTITIPAIKENICTK